MHKQITSKKRAGAISLALFFVGLGIVSIFDAWWPALMIVIGFPLALRQFLVGKYYEMLITILIFGGIYAIDQYKFSGNVILPVVFFVCALFILMREYVDNKTEQEDQKEEDLNHEIEEEKKDD